MRPRFVAIMVAIAFLAAVPGIASAQTAPGDGVSASLQFAREQVYEHECFDMTLAIEVRGVQIGRGVELAGMPDTPLLKFGQFRELPIRRSVREGRQVEIRSYRCDVRAMAPGSVGMALTLQLGLVRAQQGPFGVMRVETPITVKVEPRTVRIVALPPTPPHIAFSGAVGQFQFSATASPTNIAPGELVRIVSRVTGRGWTDGMLPPRVSPRGAFRAYEPKAIPLPAGETPELQFEQTLVPQTTNATTIPALAFSYFDPVAGAYRTAEAGPFPLQFHSRGAVPPEEQTAPIGLSGLAPQPGQPPPPPSKVGGAVRWTMIAIAGIYWLAVAVAMGAIATRMRRGIFGALGLLVIAIALFAGGVAAARRNLLSQPTATTVRQEVARVTPGPESFVSFTIPKDAAVIRLDTFGDWVKVECAGNRGWIPATALEKTR